MVIANRVMITSWQAAAYTSAISQNPSATLKKCHSIENYLTKEHFFRGWSIPHPWRPYNTDI
jgi:hypothetical protein